MPKQKESNPISLLTALISVFRAAFGVQKRENMERDLNATNPKVFILAALIFTSLFIGTLLIVVNSVIPH
jgi:hypothetical protein